MAGLVDGLPESHRIVLDSDARLLQEMTDASEQSSPFWTRDTPDVPLRLIKSLDFDERWDAVPDNNGCYIDELGQRVAIKRRLGDENEVSDVHWAAYNAAKFSFIFAGGCGGLRIFDEPLSIGWRRMVRFVRRLYKEEIQKPILLEMMRMKAQADTKATIVPEKHPYRYPALAQDPLAIRLVVVLPSTDRSSDIVCRLCNSTLSTARYEALSYVWGDPSRRKSVLLNDKPFHATENLESALRNLRHHDRPRVLWIDAMCINQSNVTERNSQVQKMGLIYGRSQRVVVWLGPESEDSSDAIDFLQSQLAPHLPIAGNHNYQEYCDMLSFYVRAVIKLLSRPWFERVWCVQEFVLGPDVTFLCGQRSLSWDYMQTIGHTFRTNSTHFQSLQCIMRDDMRLFYNFQEIVTRFARLSSWKEPPYVARSVLSALSEFSEWASSDPRDIIFGLYGLISNEHPERSALKPDYTLTTSEVYTKLATYLLQESGVLDILSLASRPLRNWVAPKERGLPSWVPDWRDSQQFGVNPSHRPIAFYGVGAHIFGFDSLYDASMGFKAAPIGPCNDNQELVLDGIDVDTIENIGEIFIGQKGTEKVAGEVLSEWKEIAGLPEEYCYQYTGQRVREAFWRTLLMDEKLDLYEETMDSENVDNLRRHRIPPNAVELDWLPRFPPSDAGDPQALRLTTCRFGSVVGRRFFKTKRGLFGLAPASARNGDHVVVLFGGKVPFILRDFGLHHLVGERLVTKFPRFLSNFKVYTLTVPLLPFSYVHGIMDGEVIHQPRIEPFHDLQVATFILA
ncbi:heterokaryon incompatibility protein-domain-containing protein [Xylaria arbuscula]|nr:heterokaryon incompatibility protein-domain-containing protein [Xylaria arbuscula]